MQGFYTFKYRHYNFSNMEIWEFKALFKKCYQMFQWYTTTHGLSGHVMVYISSIVEICWFGLFIWFQHWWSPREGTSFWLWNKCILIPHGMSPVVCYRINIYACFIIQLKYGYEGYRQFPLPRAQVYFQRRSRGK